MTQAETAYRWHCPLASCNSERSILYGDSAQVETEFSSHLSKHSIDEAKEFIKATAKWLSSFTLQEA